MSLADIPIYLVTIVVAWLLSHLVKYGIALVQHNALKFGDQIFRSGGMPSAHTTTVTALVTVIGFTDGVTSAVFGLGVMFLLIISHDAVRVRRATGEQGDALIQLIEKTKSKIVLRTSPKGHSLAEVAAGWIAGLVIGLAIFAILG